MKTFTELGEQEQACLKIFNDPDNSLVNYPKINTSICQEAHPK